MGLFINMVCQLEGCVGSTEQIQLRTCPRLRSLEQLTLDELKAKAVDLGIKRKGAGWQRCCPPNGNKSDIARAIVETTSGACAEVEPARKAVGDAARKAAEEEEA